MRAYDAVYQGLKDNRYNSLGETKYMSVRQVTEKLWDQGQHLLSAGTVAKALKQLVDNGYAVRSWEPSRRRYTYHATGSDRNTL